MKLLIDATTRVPIADQIVAGVQTWIRDNDVRPGAKLPSIRQLAAEYSISRFPVIEAYDRLVSLGLLDSRHGSGFYVAESGLTGRAGRGWSDPRRAEIESDHILEQFNYPDASLKLGGGFVPADWRDLDGLTQAIRQVSRTDVEAVIDYATPLGNTALRQLFTDPHYNVMDGLDIYIDDYSKPDPLAVGDLARMASAHALRLLKSEPDVADAAPLTRGAAPAEPNTETPSDDADLRLQPNPTPGPAGDGPGAD